MDSSDFVLGGLASVGATFFTNPIEVSLKMEFQYFYTLWIFDFTSLQGR